MPIRNAIWKVADQPVPLVESSLVNEQLLEEMILAASLKHAKIKGGKITDNEIAIVKGSARRSNWEKVINESRRC